jgi:hypothetical protein
MKSKLAIGIKERHELAVVQSVFTGKISVNLDGQHLPIQATAKHGRVQFGIGKDEKHDVELQPLKGFGNWEILVDGVALPKDTYARNEGRIMSSRIILLLPVGGGLVMLGTSLATSTGRFDPKDELFLLGIFNFTLFAVLFALTCLNNSMITCCSLLVAAISVLADSIYSFPTRGLFAIVNAGIGIFLIKAVIAAWQNRQGKAPSFEQNAESKWAYGLPDNQSGKLDSQESLPISAPTEQPLSEHDLELVLARALDKKKSRNMPPPNIPAS